MLTNGLERNNWKVPPDNTVQVVDPHGLKMDEMEKARDWRGIVIALGIISTVFVFIIIAAAIMIPLEMPPFTGRRICLNDLSNPSLVAAPMGAHWISDEEIVYVSEENGIVLLDIGSNKTRSLMNHITLNQTRTTEFYLSPNRRYILLVHDVKKERLFRQSALYSIYDVTSTHYYSLKINSTFLNHPRYQHAQWLKDIQRTKSKDKFASAEDIAQGSVEDGAELLIVAENNIHFMTNPTAPSYQITNTGDQDTVFNGVPDLIYEDIIHKSSCLWPDPTGNYLLYASINASEVSELPILSYQSESPRIVPLRYSTVGTAIPEVTILIQRMSNFDPSKLETWTIVPPSTPRMPREHYFLGADWVNERKIWISWVSRDQSTTMLATCEADLWKCSVLHSTHMNMAISPIVQNVVWSGKWAAFPWPDTTSKGSWHNHITEVGVKEALHASRILEGYHVTKILASAMDPTTSDHLIYFLGSCLNSNDGDQQLYESSDKGRVSCISCHLGCFRVTASINEALRYALVKCLGTLLPSLHIIDMQMESSFPIHIQHSLKKSLKVLALPKIINKDITLSSKLHASVTLSLPPDWKPDDETFSFPLVVQSVGIEDLDVRDAATQLGWAELLSSGHEVAHARIEILKSIPLKRISTRTTAKYMDSVIRHLLEEHIFLDPMQVFGWGWGSGGSIAIELAALNSDMFRCVAAVNPVYNWQQYASFWAERMLGPLNSEDSGQCYEESHLSRAMKTINKTKNIMLVQSLGDPLSHHSTYVARSLIENKVPFKHVVYPDHSFSLREVRLHFLQSIGNYFLDSSKCIKMFYSNRESNECGGGD